MIGNMLRGLFRERAAPSRARTPHEDGVAALAAGDLQRAEAILREVVKADASSAQALFDLGRAVFVQERWSEAAELFAASLARRPAHPLLLAAELALARARARLGLDRGVVPATVPLPAHVPFVSIVMCSIDAGRFARASTLYDARFAGLPHEIIHVGDARSLADGYNRGLARARGEIVAFSHDDVEPVSPDFAPRLLRHFERFDIVGLVGTTLLTGARWLASGWPHCHGQVAVRKPGGGFDLVVYGVDPAGVPRAQALDGFFIAARREVLECVQFDAQTFDGWDLYDVDFTYSAYRAGFGVGIANDLVMVHASGGRYGEDWRRHAAAFLAKHALQTIEDRENPGLRIGAGSEEELLLVTQHLLDRAAVSAGLAASDAAQAVPQPQPDTPSVLIVGGDSRKTAAPTRYASWRTSMLDCAATRSPLDTVREARRSAVQQAKVYDAVCCPYLLEHCYRHEVTRVLASLADVLTPEGFADIRVPDLQAILASAVDRDLDLDDVLYESPAGPVTVVDAVYGRSVEIAGARRTTRPHKTGFAAASLRDALLAAGFAEVHALPGTMPFELRIIAFMRAPKPAQRRLAGLDCDAITERDPAIRGAAGS